MISGKDTETPAVFYIPHNYIDAGSILGGTFKRRNAIEAGILAASIAAPLIKFGTMDFKTKLIIIILTALPLGTFALIGINDGSLFEFVQDAFSFLISKKNIMFFSEYQHEAELQMKAENKHQKKHQKKHHEKRKERNHEGQNC